MAVAQMWAGDDDPVLQAIRRRKQATTDPVTDPAPIPAVAPPAYEPPAPAPAAQGAVAPAPAPAPAPALDKGYGTQTLAPDRTTTGPTLPPDITGTAVVDSGLTVPAAVDKGYGQQSVGHDGTYNGMTREQWRDAWMGAGQMSAPAMDAWMAAHGATKLSDNGTFMTPYGEVLDLGIGYKTGNVTPGFTGTGSSGAGDASGTGSAAGTAGSSGGSTFQDQTRQMLLDLMKQYSQPVTASDPAIAGELQSQGRGIERTRVARRGADAERAAFQGLLNGGQSSGSFDTDVASGYEDAGSQLSDVTSQLFSRELTDRRDKLQAALSLAVQTGDAQSQRDLTLQIANMNAEIQRQSLAQQQSAQNDNYGLAAAEAQRQRDLDAARIKAGQNF